jgi:alginate O-acetyltransferase complex protein AlgI
VLFTTPVFLFLFLPVFLTTYFLTKNRFKNAVLIVFSLVFYFWAEPRFIFVVLASLVADWLLGNAIHRSSDARRRKRLVGLFVVLNVALLVYFKYMNFFVDNANTLLSFAGLKPIHWTAVALPLALSFILFEKITYGVDIYRGIGRPARTLPLYVLYSLLFPKLIAGPIVKYHEIEAQLEKRRVIIDDILAGAFRFALGLARKVWVADTLAVLADKAFQMPAEVLSPRQAWIGLLCYTFQIYFDFAGYSDMAIGLARIAGFRLRENFNFPYISTSFTEFWRRWHISLSTWIKEYLYFPLGGNRVSQSRAYFNLCFCFFISGLWHGARWSFVIWGLYHGLFLVLDKLCWLRVVERIPRSLTMPLTFLLVMIGWVFFRAPDLRHALSYIGTLFRLSSWGDHREAIIFYADNTVIFLLSVAMMSSFLPLIIRRNWRRESTLAIGAANHLSPAGIVATFALLATGVLKVATAHFEPFIYFRF